MLVIWAYDVGHGGYLNMRAKDRLAYDAAHRLVSLENHAKITSDYGIVSFCRPQPTAEREKLLDSISDDEHTIASGSSSDEDLPTSKVPQ